MSKPIEDRDRQDVIRNRKKHFKVAVKDATSEDKKWGLDAILAYNTNGHRDRLLRFSREELVQIKAAVTDWLESQTA
jgi:hypothetical protein